MILLCLKKWQVHTQVRNLWPGEYILNFIGRMGVRNSSVTKKAGTVESPKLYFSWSPHSLSLSLTHTHTHTQTHTHTDTHTHTHRHTHTGCPFYKSFFFQKRNKTKKGGEGKNAILNSRSYQHEDKIYCLLFTLLYRWLCKIYNESRRICIAVPCKC